MAEDPSSAVVSLRIVIVDDEAPARRGLRHLLSNEEDVTIVAECAAGDEAVAAIENQRPNLVFLDVQMPGLDGFGVLRSLTIDPWPMIVFVTAFDDYAPAAFDVEAIDYLLKPVTAARFQTALDRTRRRLRESTVAAQATALKSLLAVQPQKPSPKLERLLVRLGHRTDLLPVIEIDWMEADGDYVKVHAGARAHLLSQTLTSLLDQLDGHSFARIHRSKAVNLARVRSWQRLPHGEYALNLSSGHQLTAGRTYTEELTKRFRQTG